MTDTTTLYWDCECSERYIHAKARRLECPRCHAVEADQPDSHRSEVRSMLEAKIRSSQRRTEDLTEALRALNAEVSA